MKPLSDCIITQARNIPGIRTMFFDTVGNYEVVTIQEETGRDTRIVLVPEINIKYRFVDGDRSNATWKYRQNQGPKLEEVDAVAVFYAWSQHPGGLEPASSGNKFKDDYRRLCYSSEVSLHPKSVFGLYNEIRTRLSESNLLLLLQRQKLGDFVDH